MAIQKKSLIGNLTATKKAIVAKSGAEIAPVKSDLTPKALRHTPNPKVLTRPAALKPIPKALLKAPAALKTYKVLRPIALKK